MIYNFRYAQLKYLNTFADTSVNIRFSRNIYKCYSIKYIFSSFENLSSINLFTCKSILFTLVINFIDFTLTGVWYRNGYGCIQ